MLNVIMLSVVVATTILLSVFEATAILSVIKQSVATMSSRGATCVIKST
jgi:hypothetical protein